MAVEPVLNCRDIQASVDFYSRVLDFDIIAAPGTDPEDVSSRYAALSREGYILHLNSHGRDQGVFGAEIYVRVSNVDDLCKSFLAKGVQLTVPSGGTSPVDQTWGMREIGFRDPDGNKITFGQAID